MWEIRFYQGKDHFEEPFSVREAVFMQEQGFINEIDEYDDTCIHCVILNENKAVACGRFFSEAENEVTIGRIAVLKEYRMHHLGSRIVQEIERKAVEMGYTKAGLSAQCEAKGFYEKLGYHARGDVYFDEHCPHIHMEKKL